MHLVGYLYEEESLRRQNSLSFKARLLHSASKFVNSEFSSCLRNIIICLCFLAVLHVRTKFLVPRSNNSLATAVRSQAKCEYVLLYILHSTHKSITSRKVTLPSKFFPLHNFGIST